MVMESVSNNEDDKAAAKKGLPINFKSASSDDDLSNILQTIKTPVRNFLPSFLRFHFSLFSSLYLLIYYFSVSIIQAVINYGASWYVVTSSTYPLSHFVLNTTCLMLLLFCCNLSSTSITLLSVERCLSIIAYVCISKISVPSFGYFVMERSDQ